jgi:hypothetical protein
MCLNDHIIRLFLIFSILLLTPSFSSNIVNVDVDVAVVLVGFNVDREFVDADVLKTLLSQLYPSRRPYNLVTKQPYAVNYQFKYNVHKNEADLFQFEKKLVTNMQRHKASPFLDLIIKLIEKM